MSVLYSPSHAGGVTLGCVLESDNGYTGLLYCSDETLRGPTAMCSQSWGGGATCRDAHVMQLMINSVL